MPTRQETLASVLATITEEASESWWHMMQRDADLRFTLSGVEQQLVVWAPLRSWRFESPSEALDELHLRGLYPWPMGEGPRWWCEQCYGRGLVSIDVDYGTGVEYDHCEDCAVEDPEATGGYRTTGHTADPSYLAALVAVASLSAPTLLAVEGLARELAARDGCPKAQPVWRVMTREKIERHAEAARVRYGEPGYDSPAAMYADEAFFAAQSDANAAASWPEIPPHASPRAVATWPIVRDLALLGVATIALDSQRIVLGVEALP